jgi:hypothetical protein
MVWIVIKRFVSDGNKVKLFLCITELLKTQPVPRSKHSITAVKPSSSAV